MISKRKIIYFLVVVAAMLLFLNLLLGLSKKENLESEVIQLSRKDLETKFLSTLDNFGISQDWIKKNRLSKGKYDSVKYKYNVQIPVKVSIPVVIKDLSEALSEYNIDLESYEKENRAATSLSVKYDKITKLVAELRYDNSLKRTFSRIAFLLTDYAELNKDQRTQILNIPFTIGIVLPLDSESPNNAEWIKSKNLDYFILIADESNDSRFELGEDLGIDKLTSSVSNIISSFNSPEIFFISSANSNFDYSMENFIQERFNKRGRRIVDLEEYTILKGEDRNDLISRTDFHFNNLEPGQFRVFKVEFSDWLLIQDEISKFVKKGNQVVKPSSLL